MNDPGLEAGAYGDPVSLLQQQLRQAGYEISAGEAGRRFYGPATRAAVMQYQQDQGLPVTGRADPATLASLAAAAPLSTADVEGANATLVPAGTSSSPAPGSQPSQPVAPLQGSGSPAAYSVQGQVTWADGAQAAGVLVRAVDQDLRTEQPLGEATTDAGGGYEIRYTAAQFAHAEDDTADLIVRALDETGAVLASSPVLFNAPAQATVDLVISGAVAGQPSEYDRVVALVTPLLSDLDPPSLTGLETSDLPFLVGETGIDQARITALLTAASLSRDATAAGTVIPVAAFYALIREGAGSSWAALSLQPTAAITAKLAQAASDGTAPADLSAEAGRLASEIVGVAVRRALGAPSQGQTGLSQLLGAASLPPAQQETLVTLAASSTGPPQDFWAQLRTLPGFQTPGVVEKLQLTLQLGLLTGNNAPLIQALLRDGAATSPKDTGTPPTGPVTSPRDLAGMDQAAWTALLAGQVDGQPIGVPPGVPGATPAQQAANYVTGIVATLQAAFPNETVAHLVTTQPTLIPDAATRQAVGQFLADSPDFDLRSTRVSAYLATHAATAFAGIPAAQQPAVTDQVKRLQRALQISVSADTIATLLDLGLDAAHLVADIPRQSFLDRFGARLGGTDTATAVHERAQYINSRSLLILASINDAANGAATTATGNASNGNAPTQVQAALIKRLPDYAELFGSLDLCQCEDCRSVTSPAAYLVNLLEFLRNSTPNAAGNTPLDVLVGSQNSSGNTILGGRRPDLANIKLTCENTNTELPYIDLVNEILESFVCNNYTAVASAAHDTGDTPTAELNANPQWTLEGSGTSPGPYAILAQQNFPFSLPYNQPIAVARTYLSHLRTSRYQLLDTFQVPPSSAQQAVDAEFLCMDPYLYQLLTGQTVTGAPAAGPPLYELYGYTTPLLPPAGNAPSVPWENDLGQVPVFLQRTGTAIADVISLLTTRFANPGYPTGPDAEFLTQIPLSYADLLSLATAGFPASPAPGIADALTAADLTVQQLQSWWTRNPQLGNMIVIDTTDGGCDLTTSRLVHLQDVGAEVPVTLTDSEFQAMQAFIRLWRVLGWTMTDLDRAITALGATAITPALISGLARIQQLNQTLNPPSLQMLFALWADLVPDGSDSLYAQLFENPATLPLDPAFQPDTTVHPPALLPGTESISDHIPALLAALKISASDLTVIRDDAGLTDQPSPATPVPLTLDNVTALYRYAALAQLLGLQVSSLISVKTLAGAAVNPVKTPLDPVCSPDTTLAFVALARAVQNSGFTTVQLDYLYRHISAPPTGLAPDDTTFQVLAVALRQGLTQIIAANTQAPDPTGTLTHAKLTQLVTKEVADQAVAMINGTATYSTPLIALPSSIASTNASSQVTGIDPGKLPADVQMKLSYDPAAQTLSFTGAMTTAEQSELSQLPAVSADFQAALNSLYQQPADFISDSLNGPSGILGNTDATTLLQLLRANASLDGQLNPVYLDQQGNPVPPSGNTPVTTVAAADFACLLGILLPYLISQLSHTLVKQTAADTFSLSAEVTSLLLEDILTSPATPTNPVIGDLLALATPGLTAVYTSSSATTSATVVAVDFDGTMTTLPPGTTAATFSALVDPPATGSVTFSIQTNGSPQLWVADAGCALTQQPDGSYASAPVLLTAAQLVPVLLQIADLPAAGPSATFSWQSATQPRSAVPGASLLPQGAYGNYQQAYIRIQKAALLVGQFALTAPEISYLTSAAAGSLVGFDLNALPLAAGAVTAVQSVALFAFWPHLQAYTALRNSLPGGQTTLTDVFTAPTAAAAATLLPQATGWDPQVVEDLFSAFGLAAGSANPIIDDTWLTTLQACISVAQLVGADIGHLASWARPDVNFSDLQAAADEIKRAARSHYDPVTWLTVAQPLSDVIRAGQRDALVACIMATEGYTDPNSLFELLLIDPEMGTCMPASRISLAISSVQLFVQRCLLSLEQRDDAPAISVSPSAIDRQAWSWVSQYSVWAAAVEVFLWPENWLIPSLRDDMTPIFEDFESQLLQNSLTSDTAQAAILAYLESLHEIDRLDIRAVYWQDVDPDTGEPVDILHVIGRTFHAPNKYFYRQLLGGTTWTPWAPLQVDISGDHLLAVVWDRRLRIIWPVFTSAAVTGDLATAAQTPPTYWEISLAWSEYSQGAWLPKQVTDDFLLCYYDTKHTILQPPIDQVAFLTSIDDTGALFVRVYFDESLGAIPGLIGQFTFSPGGDATGLSYTHLQDGWPQGINMYPAEPGTPITDDFLYLPTGAGSYNDGFRECGGNAGTPLFGSLWLPSVANWVTTGNPDQDEITLRGDEEPYLGLTPSAFDLRYSRQYGQFAMQAPFFYQDDTSTFFVTPTTPGSVFRPLTEPARVDAKSIVKSAVTVADTAVADTTVADTTVADTTVADTTGKADDRSATYAIESGDPSWAATTDQSQSNWAAGSNTREWGGRTELTFASHWHPYVEEWIKALYREQDPSDTTGVEGLINLVNQSLGNPYLATPWNPLSWQAGTVTTAWQAAASQQAFPASLVQAGFGSGPVLDFEAVILDGTDLVHYHLDNSGTGTPWQPGETITASASGPGAIALSDQESTLHVLVPQGSDLVHYVGTGTAVLGSARPSFSWTAEPGELVASGVTGPSPLFTSFLTGANGDRLDCLVLQGPSLVHYSRESPLGEASTGWHALETVTTSAAGAAGLTGDQFNYLPLHAVVPEQPAGSTGPPWVLNHYSYDGAAWTLADTVTTSAYGPGCLIVSSISDGPAGNLEVVVLEDQGLVHYWYDTGQGAPWQQGQLISSAAAAGGCIIQSTLLSANAPAGSAGDFEVLVPEANQAVPATSPPTAVRVVHYRHQNSDVPASQDGHYEWAGLYVPETNVAAPYPVQAVDFSNGGAYADYNWELFFHIPVMVATQLSQNQQFEAADTWLRYVIDLTNDSPNQTAPGRYWEFLPFKTTPIQTITQLMEHLDTGDPGLLAQVNDWRQNPFMPYQLARLRNSAFMKSVFMLWASNHLAWGDYLYGQIDTVESINLAEQHYVLVSDALGPRPATVPPPGTVPAQTYGELIQAGTLDSFGNLIELIENEFPDASAVPAGATGDSGGLLGLSKVFFFCIPQNATLLAYWDTVADRLFKIRNCMNIQGQVQQLPLFQPPINPALLVEAAAEGIDLGNVLADLNAPPPNYRFSYLLERAEQLCADVRTLGAELLSALEKQDSEHLAALRADQEVAMLQLTQSMKQDAVSEASAAINALTVSQDIAFNRYSLYQMLLTGAIPTAPNPPADLPMAAPPNPPSQSGGLFQLLTQEQNELNSAHSARDWKVRAATMEMLASIADIIPTLTFPAGAAVSASFGGVNIGYALEAVGRYQTNLAQQDEYDMTTSGRLAGHIRRAQEWTIQANQAAGEYNRIRRELITANCRLAVAQDDQKVNALQTTNAQAVAAYLTAKYTNEQLYSWMAGQVSGLYSQLYQMAYSMAQLAERAYQLELGIPASSYIQFGYWDSLRKGLLAGERLELSLMQLERAYLDQNKRELEITRYVSLLLHHPIALIALKETGQCVVELPEQLFDLDYPGHYLRRIRNVSLTIPCVAGPYTNINCTLTLLSSKVRWDPSSGGGYPEQGSSDPRFIYNYGATQAIATSHAQNDSGLFEVNFRDERYLPFETAGIISRWQITMPQACNAFDFNTITDVIIKLSYTARDGGDLLRSQAFTAAKLPALPQQTGPSPMGNAPSQDDRTRLFSARHEFPTEWYGLLHPADATAAYGQMPMLLTTERFPFQYRGDKITTGDIEVFVILKDLPLPAGTPAPPPDSLTVYITSQAAPPAGTDSTPPADPTPGQLNLAQDPIFGNVYHGTMPQSGTTGIPEVWWLSVPMASFSTLVDQIDDAFIVFHYNAAAPS
jgi:peptidoglycan hydrolase-like protein with peptidoglycan-binding domain